jgi:two-component system, cell cycle sensor histidine kinase and response regulator CckA
MTEDLRSEQKVALSNEQTGWLHRASEHGQHTVLLVEDESFVRGVVSEILRSEGYSVLIAKDASEACRLYESHRGRIELLLTDLVLPGEDGRALGSRLRQNNPHLKVLLMSGYAERVATLNACDGHAEEWMSKPFSGERLLEKVRWLLDSAELRTMQNGAVKRACDSA